VLSTQLTSERSLQRVSAAHVRPYLMPVVCVL
jgi:hypothetical protein